MIPAWKTHGYWCWTVRSGLKSVFQFNQKVFDRGYVQTKLSSSTLNRGNLFFMDLTLCPYTVAFLKDKKQPQTKTTKTYVERPRGVTKVDFITSLSLTWSLSLKQMFIYSHPTEFLIYSLQREHEKFLTRKGFKVTGARSAAQCTFLASCPATLYNTVLSVLILIASWSKNFPLPCCLKCTNR